VLANNLIPRRRLPRRGGSTDRHSFLSHDTRYSGDTTASAETGSE
jgi:hypothetical protein